jgi:hypothetical protein
VFVGTAAGALVLSARSHLGLESTIVAVLVGGGAPAGLFLAWATYRLAADQTRPTAVERAERPSKPVNSQSFSPVLHASRVLPADLPGSDPALDPQTQARILAIDEELDRHDIRTQARDWILNDQLSSGGWGKSLSALTTLTNGREPTNLERNEGGILTTFVSVSALRNYESKLDSFLGHKSSRAALRYLIAHQGADGGFGRFVESRSGTELMRGERHTTFALSALLDLEGPIKVISAGLEFLVKRSPRRDWSDDASPSLLIAGLLNLYQRLRAKSVAEPSAMSGQMDSWMESFDSPKLYSELASAATSTPWAPLWKPYASHPDLLFDTAIRTISMLPRPLAPEIRSTVIRAVEYISEYQCEGGIPYTHGHPSPDMSTLVGLVPADAYESNYTDRFDDLTSSLLDFITSNWGKTEYREMFYSETTAYTLLVGTSV